MRRVITLLAAAALVGATLTGSLGAGQPGAAAAVSPGSSPVAPDPDHASSARAAGPAVTLGQTTGPTSSCNGGPNIGAASFAAGPGTVSYEAGFDGILTSFSHNANAVAGQVQAVVFSDGISATQKVTVAHSARQTVALGTTNTFPMRLPIKAGQRVGLAIRANGMACSVVGVSGDSTGVTFYDPETDPSLNASPIGFVRPNVSAVLEPDADKDGFGDVSQDLCPQLATTQAACPAPDVTVTKQPKKRSSKRKAKIGFTSTVAGSTFTCAVDGKAATACVSPFKKKFTYGKHTVVVTATSPLGIVDPSPAVVTFKVTKPKPKS